MKHFILLTFALLFCSITYAQNDFITTWETTTASETITIPTNTAAHTYNYTVDWGDGTTTTGRNRQRNTYLRNGR